MELFTKVIPPCKAREQHSFAHAFLRETLSEVFQVTDFTLEKNSYGKPKLANYPNLYFNLSHTEGLILLGVDTNPLGVDCEKRQERKRDAVIKRCFGEEEKAFLAQSQDIQTDFLRLWTLKESYVKALGLGLSYPMQKTNFVIHGDEITCQDPNYQFQTFLTHTHIYSVCWKK